MPTSVDTYLPYDAGTGANVAEDSWRLMMRNLFRDGPLDGYLNEFAAYADNSGMQVKVPSGACWIQGHYGESTSEKTLSIAANSSGNPRIDRVILRNDFVNNRIELDVLTGTPAGSPSAPALTTNSSIFEIPLARVAVADAETSIESGHVTDERSFANPMAMAQGKTATTQSVNDSSWTEVALTGADDFDTHAIHNSSSTTPRMTIPGGFPGRWEFGGLVEFAADSDGARGVRLDVNNTTQIDGPLIPAVPASTGVTRVEFGPIFIDGLVAGDTVDLQAWHNAGAAINIVSARYWCRYSESRAPAAVLTTGAFEPAGTAESEIAVHDADVEAHPLMLLGIVYDSGTSKYANRPVTTRPIIYIGPVAPSDANSVSGADGPDDDIDLWINSSVA